MKILVANIGSTSLKYRLYEIGAGGESLLGRGAFERVTDYASAITACLKEIQGQGLVQDQGELAAVGFKTVLAAGVSGCVRIDEDVLQAMEMMNAVAPAHNPPYLQGIRMFAERMPKTPLVALFETAFYQTAPEAAMRYAVPGAWHDLGVRRYGFHGASHKFVAERSATLLGRDDVAARARQLYGNPPEVSGPPLRVISCHLGGSSSVTAILNGAGIGTSMGLSPQSGLPQNNRTGDLDPFAVFLLHRRGGMSLEEIERQLCSASGLAGLSGGSNDVRDIRANASSGDAQARLALDVLAHQTRHWIGASLAQLGGADALVFTAGIGENDAQLRAEVCVGLEQLGFVLDTSKNVAAAGNETEVSTSDSPVRIWVIPTNEELMVAREVHRLLSA